MKSLFRIAIAFAALPLLAGCNSTTRIAKCPVAAILADTATVTEFRAGAAADLSGEAFTAIVMDVKTDCDFDRKAGITKSSLDVSFRATRAPSADAMSYSVPYYVAITQGARVMSKRIFTARFDFQPGATVATVTDSVDETEIHLENGHPPPDYQLMAGFQLTDAQRAYNTKMGRYVQ